MNSLRRGWCPTLFRPMGTGDGLLCRIKPFLSRITSEQAHFIANAATEYGNEHINLTQKANLQLRGFTQAGIDQLIPKAIHEGLLSPSQNQEEKRNILVSPLMDFDATCHPDTKKLAHIVHELLSENEHIHALSGKFSIIIDGGGVFPLTSLNVDINIRAYQKKWIIQLGHMQQGIPCTTQTVQQIILHIIHYCMQHDIKRLISNKEASAYLQQTDYPIIDYQTQAINTLPSIGVIKPLGLHIGIPFGLLTAQNLHDLGNVATCYGKSILCLTPWRSIVLPHCSIESLPYLSDFITTNDDPRLHIILCPGYPACSKGQQNILQDVHAFLPIWKNQQTYLHISGCAKGCAFPQEATVTARAATFGYDIIFQGKADQETPYTDLNLTDAVSLLKKHLASSSQEKIQ